MRARGGCEGSGKPRAGGSRFQPHLPGMILSVPAAEVCRSHGAGDCFATFSPPWPDGSPLAGYGAQSDKARSVISCLRWIALGLAGFPLCIQLGDGRTDGETPGKNRKILEFLGNRVAMLGLFGGNAGFKHFLSLAGD